MVNNCNDLKEEKKMKNGINKHRNKLNRNPINAFLLFGLSQLTLNAKTQLLLHTFEQYPFV